MTDRDRGRVGIWNLERVLQETAYGEADMKNLEIQNIVDTYKRMSDVPTFEVPVKQIVRGNGLPFLSDLLYEENLESLKEAFQRNEKNSLSKEMLIDWLESNINEKYLRSFMQTFDKFFNMIDLDLDGVVTWTEVIGYLEKEMVERFHLVNGYTPPFIGNYIQGPTKQIPNRHKRLITAIKFWPSVQKSRELQPGVGRYVSVSDNGIVDFFNLDMKPLGQSTLPSPWGPAGAMMVVKTMCVLPELNVLCLGCIARDLCFYQQNHDSLELVYHITNFDTPPVGMVYKFYEDPSRRSYIAIGGVDGSVTAILFRTDSGGPFKRPQGQASFTTQTYHNIRMGRVEGLEARDFRSLHSRWVESLVHLDPLGCLLSTSNSGPVALALLDVEERCVLASIDAPLGITCAALLSPPPKLSSLPVTEYEDLAKGREKKALNWWVVTGGLDTRLRIWDLSDTRRPRYTLTGHISRIKFIIVQHDDVSDCPLIISYGRIGRINVWNARTFENLQLYTAGLAELPEGKPLSHCYNPHYKLLLLCTYKILSLKIGRFVDKCVTSGKTEAHEIVTALYNATYHKVVTVTLGSVITRWDPESGEKQLVMPQAHLARSLAGDRVPGITAATFNPEENLLATGAEDGSVRLWDHYRGVFVRSLQAPGPVRWMVWLKFGLLVGTNEGKFRLFEASPPHGGGHSSFDLGPTVSALAFVPPAYLVLGSLRGELLFTDFATGRPIRRFLVSQPGKWMAPGGFFVRDNEDQVNEVVHWEHFVKCGGSGRIPVEEIYLLEWRKVEPGVGNLVVALRTGFVQFWSTHPEGGFVDCFYAVHHTGDTIVSFATDRNHHYLFTGHAYGYLKLWWLGDWGLGPGDPGLRPPTAAPFPYLSPDFADAPAMVVLRREEHAPVLLNCYRAHAGAVTVLLYFDQPQVVLSSAMKAVRYWTLTGKFLNSFGCNLEWIPYDLRQPVVARETRIPSDLKRILSRPSLQVLNGDYKFEDKAREKEEEEDQEDEEEAEMEEQGSTAKDGEVTVLAWKRADVGKLWKDVKEAQQHIQTIPSLPDLGQEQLYQFTPFHKTEKVTWIKPPKIIRSKRKRLELSILYDTKKECCECEKEKKQNQERKEFLYNKGISLEEGVKLLEKEKAIKEEKEKCSKCYWKVREKVQEPLRSHLLDSEFLGEASPDIMDNFGILLKAAAEKDIGEACLFGKRIPTSKTELDKFISEALSSKGISDTSKNRELLRNLIYLERKRGIVKDLQSLGGNHEDKLMNFDCFTEKEKRAVMRRVKEDQAENKLRATVRQTDGGSVSGVYSFLANCLFETEYMDLPNSELLNLLGDLSKRLKKSHAQDQGFQGYKKRFEWWRRMKGSKRDSAAFQKVVVTDQVVSFVNNLLLKSETLAGSKDLFYDFVREHLMQIVLKQPCPGCGAEAEVRREGSPVTEQVIMKMSKMSRKFNALLKSSLVKASVGEIREEDAFMEFCKFLGKIVERCLPPCGECRDKQFLDPSQKDGEKTEKIMHTLGRVTAFCKSTDVAYEQNLHEDYQRSKLFFKRKRDIDRLEKIAGFEKEKEINIGKYERRMDKLRNSLVSIVPQDREARKKRDAIKLELAATKAKIKEEYTRKLSD